MVPPDSDRAPPTPPYSGYGLGWRSFRVRGCHPLRPAFPGAFRYNRFFHDGRPTTPRAPRRPRFGLAPFRSPLLGGSLLFSFPPTTGMFRFPFAPPRRLSRPAASFVASGSQGILRTPCLASRSCVRLAHRCARLARVSFSCVCFLSHPVKEPRHHSGASRGECGARTHDPRLAKPVL